jgi:peptidoglycan/LPS O-acetylase OafA/YrhL
LAAIIWFLPTPILVYFIVWLLGAVLYLINGRVLVPLWISSLLFAVSFGIARLQWLTVPYLADFLIGISFALIINSSAESARRLPSHRWNRTAAGFSYSVYLCHFPILVFVLSMLFQEGWLGLRQQPTPKLAGAYLFVLIFVYSCCFFVSMVTERQTPQIRAWLNNYLGKKTSLQEKGFR